MNFVDTYDDDLGAYEYETELAKKAVDEFTGDRLKSYYVEHPELAVPAFAALEKAKLLLQSEPEAALIFAYSAIEIMTKLALLMPVLYGLVHTEAVAALVLTVVPNRANIGIFKPLLFEILARFGGVDLNHFKRKDSKQTLWEEIQNIGSARNHFLHEGKPVPPNSPGLAVEAASEMAGIIFPAVIGQLGLHLHGPHVCQKYHGTGFAPA